MALRRAWVSFWSGWPDDQGGGRVSLMASAGDERSVGGEGLNSFRRSARIFAWAGIALGVSSQAAAKGRQVKRSGPSSVLR
jgi:hypothetical protein